MMKAKIKGKIEASPNTKNSEERIKGQIREEDKEEKLCWEMPQFPYSEKFLAIFM
jgi:hypothetical protein